MKSGSNSKQEMNKIVELALFTARFNSFLNERVSSDEIPPHVQDTKKMVKLIKEIEKFKFLTDETVLAIYAAEQCIKRVLKRKEKVESDTLMKYSRTLDELSKERYSPQSTLSKGTFDKMSKYITLMEGLIKEIKEQEIIFQKGPDKDHTITNQRQLYLDQQKAKITLFTIESDIQETHKKLSDYVSLECEILLPQNLKDEITVVMTGESGLDRKFAAIAEDPHGKGTKCTITRADINNKYMLASMYKLMVENASLKTIFNLSDTPESIKKDVKAYLQLFINQKSSDKKLVISDEVKQFKRMRKEP